ncbi:MAG: hypothetical protein Q8R76_05135 [Candidatus Omnitrophota bacterium]|nr:hypothetical protein [Candidatus Omnitrophota bacterium]
MDCRRIAADLAHRGGGLMLRGVLLSLSLTAVGIIVQIVTAHALRPRKMFNHALLIFVGSFPVFVFLYYATAVFWPGLPAAEAGMSELPGLINGLLFHALLFLNYVQCLYYLTQPVTLRVLMEMARSGDAVVRGRAINAMHSFDHMVSTRFEVLVLHQFARREGERYYLTQKGERFALVFKFLRRLFGISYYLKRAATAI